VLGDRAFWAGLEDAKLGQVRIGLQDQFTRTNWLAHDQLAFANVSGNLAHNGNGGAAGTASHTALSTAVNYISPRFSGVQFSLGMTQNDNTTTDSAKTKGGSGSQVGLSYVAGKFSAGLAYVEATTSTRGTADDDELNVQISSLKTKDTSAAASYDFGVAKVAYIYNKRDASQGVAESTSGQVDRTSHSFSASAPLTAKLIARLGYGMGEYRSGAVDAYEGDIKGYQVALNYSLSKRTTIYGIYGNEKRDTAANADLESKEYSVGVRHAF
jgi:predicted porin